nr:HNH endonuclease signature motif containing protein [Gryllotalpicola protaetiae]
MTGATPSCVYCGHLLVVRADGFSGRGTPTKAQFGVDHIISLAAGGTHDARNWVPSCGRCNRSKREFSIADWIARDIAAGREPHARLVLGDLAAGSGAWRRDPQTGEIYLANRSALVRP